MAYIKAQKKAKAQKNQKKSFEDGIYNKPVRNLK